MVIYLNEMLATKVNREEFMKRFTQNAPFDYYKSVQPYKMLTGTPILQNVEGAYIKLDDIPNLVYTKRFGIFANQYVMAVKNGELPPAITFKWWRFDV